MQIQATMHIVLLKLPVHMGATPRRGSEGQVQAGLGSWLELLGFSMQEVHMMAPEQYSVLHHSSPRQWQLT